MNTQQVYASDILQKAAAQAAREVDIPKGSNSRCHVIENDMHGH